MISPKNAVQRKQFATHIKIGSRNMQVPIRSMILSLKRYTSAVAAPWAAATAEASCSSTARVEAKSMQASVMLWP